MDENKQKIKNIWLKFNALGRETIDWNKINSIEFIAFVVEIEQEFSVEFPPELLDYKVFGDYNDIEKMILKMIEESKRSQL